MALSSIAENEIRKFLIKWWTAVNQQLQTATQNQVQLQQAAPIDQLLASDLGQALLRIVEIADTQPLWSQTTAKAILADAEKVEAWLFQTSFTQHPSESFWNTSVGFYLLSARLWAEQDRLVSLKEAAELSGLSLSSLSQRISRGQMQFFRDPNEANPQRARRIRLSDLEMFIREGFVRKAGFTPLARLSEPALASRPTATPQSA